MSRAKCRSHRKLQRVNLAKTGWVYWRRDVLLLYGIHTSTLTNWTKAGLKFTRSRNRQVFRGDDLNAFHRGRRDAARWTCSGGQLPCFTCRSGVVPASNAVTIERREPNAAVIRWTCSQCGKEGRISARERLQNRLRSAGITLNSTNANGDS